MDIVETDPKAIHTVQKSKGLGKLTGKQSAAVAKMEVKEKAKPLRVTAAQLGDGNTALFDSVKKRTKNLKGAPVRGNNVCGLDKISHVDILTHNS